MSLFDSASLVVTPNGVKAGKLYSIKPTDGSGDLSVTRATTATRVNANGLIETVGANVPRLDYSNGGCPSILVEPQRTNLLLNTLYDGANGETPATSWGIGFNTGTTTTEISPRLSDAIRVTHSGTSQREYYRQSCLVTSGITYTFSAYFANVTAPNAIMLITSLGGVVTGQTSLTGSSFTNPGIYSISFTATVTGFIELRLGLGPSGNSTGIVSHETPQLEAGSNATSYISTAASAVTRNADVISKTGISDLIGQTEGTLYSEIEVKNLGISRQIFNITKGTANFLSISFLSTNIIRTTIRANAGTIYNVSTTALSVGKYKIAATYKNAELKLYVNGSLIGTNTNASISWSLPLDQVNLDNSVLGNENFSDDINSAALWKTALTDEQLATLTTI
jgi:hypothetical protein